MRPFRFGAAFGDAPDGPALRDLARKVEDAGYATFLIPDHFVNDYSPAPVLATAAAVTSLRIGTLVFDNDFRHPAVLAKDVATLDVMSDGRMEPGIGAGWHEPEYRAAGLPFDPAPVRVSRLEESVKILKGLWSGEPFSFKGEHYEITDMTGLPKPAQQPHPPLMIGAGGMRMTRLAAREADIVSFCAHLTPAGVDTSSLTEAGFLKRLDLVRRESAGRDVELSNYYSTPAVLTDDRDAGIRRILDGLTGRFGDTGLTPDDILASPHYLVGDEKQMIDALVERRERYGVSYIVFTDDVLQYAGVVSALAGM